MTNNYLHIFTTPTTDAPPYPMCQLYIFRHYCYTLCVYCAKIGVFKQTNQVGLTCLLQAPHCIHCKSQAKMHFICNFMY